MSGFFSLGGKDHHHHHHHQPDHPTDTNNNNNNSLFLFKNEEIYNKGFELWQQYYQLHQQRLHHNHHNNHHAAIQDVDFTVGPSRRNNNTTSSIFGADIGDDSENYSYRSAVSGFRMMRQGSGRGAGEGINCQDCGNQAKKDCAHMRCRTCCKSRGFPCHTHVKSTWVPAAKRRERQQQLAALQQEEQQLTVRGENPKRLRESPHGGGSAVACTPSSRLAATTSGFESAHFPPEVNSSAVFRCVKVSAMDDAEEHLAYQTAVNIAGHVFRGILYDHGPEGRYSGEGSSAAGGPQQQPLDLITAASASSAGIATTTSTNLAMIDPAMNYPTPLSAFMAGTQFFPPPRP